ncbi:MAG: hypothetical protein M3R36_05700 [Bacteroidota bacterium]|nr:hypothetical protein [Bacteroidota bacterium]
MKLFYKFLFVSIILLLNVKSYSQIPEYTLEAKNFVLVNPYRITFDIVLTHTDSDTYEVAGWQYIFKVPQSLGAINGGSGTNSGFQYDSLGGQPISDLPVHYYPRNPSVTTRIINGIPSNELRLAFNQLPSQSYSFFLAQNVPYLIMRMKIISFIPFNLSNLNFAFRDSCTDSPVSVPTTRISAVVGIDFIEITKCVNHTVDISGILLPPISCEIRLAPEGLYNSMLDKLNRSETVTAYLRNQFSPYHIIDSAQALIDSNILTGNFQFSTATAAGTYYIVIRHRNTIETWSKDGGENLVRGNNNYDFTSSVSQAYGGNMILKGSRYCIYSGNVNNDMIIDTQDLLLIDNDLFNYETGSTVTDLTGDNLVDLEDMAIANENAANLIMVEWPGLNF